MRKNDVRKACQFNYLRKVESFTPIKGLVMEACRSKIQLYDVVTSRLKFSFHRPSVYTNVLSHGFSP